MHAPFSASARTPRAARVVRLLQLFSEPSMNDPNAGRDAATAHARTAPAPLGDERLRRVLDALPAPVSYVDAELRFLYNNSAYDRWVGRPHAELFGLPVREVLGERAYAVVLPHMQIGRAHV